MLSSMVARSLTSVRTPTEVGRLALCVLSVCGESLLLGPLAVGCGVMAPDCVAGSSESVLGSKVLVGNDESLRVVLLKSGGGLA